MADRRVICTKEAPISKFPLSQAVVANKTVYVSGQVGLDPVLNHLVPGGVEPECRQVLTNLGAILKAAGGNFKDVFKEPYPARAAYAVAKLPLNCRVEIEAVAVIEN